MKRKHFTGKRALCLFAVLLLALSCVLLTGCKKDKKEKSGQGNSGQTSQEAMKNAKVGDHIFFGSYEQDNNTANGKEPIEWIVLEREGSKALLISRYVLDCQQFNPEWIYGESSLNKWMNGTFIDSAFNAEEQSRLRTTEGWKKHEVTVPPGEGTPQYDTVFLLWYRDLDDYFNYSAEARKCAPTDYAVAQGAVTGSFYEVDNKATCRWWYDKDNEGYRGCVDYDGSFSSAAPWNTEIGVRPAVWVDLG